MSMMRKTDNRERNEPRRKRKTGHHSNFVHFLDTHPAVGVALFLITALGIGYLSFIGVSFVGHQVVANQPASMRIVAGHPFEYESQIKTERRRNEIRNRVPPAFQIEMEPYDEFILAIRRLRSEIDRLAEDIASLSGAERTQAIQEFTSEYNRTAPHRIAAEDVTVLLRHTDPSTRRILFDTGVVTLREIYREGIYDPDAFQLPGAAREAGLTVLNLIRPDGEVTERNIQTEEQALQFLRINLVAPNVPQEVSIALYRIFRSGIVPNIRYDDEKTEELRSRVIERVEPVTVRVSEGQSIIEPGVLVTEEQHEMLAAYRKELAEQDEGGFHLNELVIHRFLLVSAILFGAVIYLRIDDPSLLKSNGRLLLLAMVAFLSLAVIWGIIHLGNHPLLIETGELLSLLPFLAPYALAPLIVSILMGARPAIFMALLTSFFAAIMYGNRIDVFTLSFLSALFTILFTQHVRLRKTVVKAAVAAGSVVAIGALLLGLASGTELLLIGQQMLAAQLAGFLTGVVVVGLLPVLETLFGRTTDITLLELTDTNHPLLKRMQLNAPGTYHHSLVVANLAENAATAIGANALVCRVCSIFHDIGKLIKPEYFIENQRHGVNPHADRTPSFSALVIKSHVKDGVDLAVKYKLPRIIVDVIRQHHGTSLIQYFFHQAKQKETKESESLFRGAARLDSDKVSESTYRYDGPRPQFKESAIILFADSLEAASRTLKKVSPPNIDELIDKIISDRIEDGQLDQCPLTMQEIARMRKSFSYTLLNMLHSRIEYPDDGKETAKSAAGDQPAHSEDATKKNPAIEPMPGA